MKKLLAFLLVLTLAVTFVACSNPETGDTETTDKPGTAGAPETPKAPETPEPIGTPEDTGAVSSVMSYADYVAAEMDTKVTVEAFIQAKQGWWEKDGVGVATFYTQNEEGAFFVYEMPCSKEDYDNKLTAGAKIRVTGTKTTWEGEIEIADATYEVLEGTWTATALDITDKLADEKLIDYQNQFVAFKGMTVVAIKDKDGNEAPFLYNWDGSGIQGNDLYFNVSIGDATYNFCVESYLTGADTDVYKAVEALQIGDVIDMEGFLYWYQGANPHITSVKPAATAETTAETAAETAA